MRLCVILIVGIG